MKTTPPSAPSIRTYEHVAHYNQTREYESRIHEYRVTKNLKLRELALLADVNVGAISALANGMQPPLKADGRLTASAEKLVKFFKCDVDDLFPRYFCSMRNDYLADDQTLDLLEGEWSMDAISDPYDLYLRELFVSEIKLVFETLSDREEQVLILRFGLFGQDEHTFDAVGEILSIGRERVRQIEKLAMRRLRGSSYRLKKLAQYSTFSVNDFRYSDD